MAKKNKYIFLITKISTKENNNPLLHNMTIVPFASITDRASILVSSSIIGILSDDMFLYFAYNVAATFDITSLTTIFLLYKENFS